MTITELPSSISVIDDIQPPWMDEAGVKCKGLTPFFYASRSNVEVANAKAVCNGADGKGCCSMLKRCQQYAMAHNELYGVWGGMSERDRQKVRKARKVHGGHITNLEGVRFPGVAVVERRTFVWVSRKRAG